MDRRLSQRFSRRLSAVSYFFCTLMKSAIKKSCSPVSSALVSVCLVFTFCSATFCPAIAFGQIEEMKTIDKIGPLQKQLDSGSFDERDEAEKELIKLGPVVLDYLDDPSEDFSSDKNERLIRIRKQLEQAAIRVATSPSKISLSGTMTVKEAISEIKLQSDNVLGLAEGYDESVLEKEIEIDLKDATFWQAATEVMNRGGFQTVVYGSMPGQLTIIPIPPVQPDAIDQAQAAPVLPRDESGIFSTRVVSVSSAKNLIAPQLDYTRVELVIQWEPRLNPVSIEMPLSEVKVVDDQGKPLELSNTQGTISGLVQAGVSQVEMSITLKHVTRKVQGIKSLTAKLDCVLPGRREKFRFDSLGTIEGEPSISKAGMIVQYMGYEENEDLYGVNIRIAMEDPATELESHLQWIYDNPLFLVSEDGKREPSIGQQGGGMDEEGMLLQYFFVEDPSNFSLLYESPGAIVSVPANISLKNIPLP